MDKINLTYTLQSTLLTPLKTEQTLQNALDLIPDGFILQETIAQIETFDSFIAHLLQSSQKQLRK